MELFVTCHKYIFIGDVSHCYRQADIGLIAYERDILVLLKELFTPTFFLVITIVQVHCFHKEYLKVTNFEEQSTSSPVSTTTPSLLDSSSSSSPPKSTSPNSAKSSSPKDVKVSIEEDVQSDEEDDDSPPTVKSAESPNTSDKPDRSNTASSGASYVTPIDHLSQQHSSDKIEEEEEDSEIENKTSFEELKELAYKFYKLLKPKFRFVCEVIWRFLEIHMIKIVFAFAIWVALSDVSYPDIFVKHFVTKYEINFLLISYFDRFP